MIRPKRVLAIVVALLWSGLATVEANPPPQEAPLGPLKGFLEPAASVDVRCQVNGTSTLHFLVPEGKTVKKGTLLAELDVTNLMEALDRQRVMLEQTRAMLVGAEVRLATGQEESRATLDVAERALASAEGALELFSSKKGQYQLELRQAGLEVLVAKKRVKLVMRVLERVKKEPESPEREFVLEEHELELTEAKARLELAQEKLRFLEGAVRARKIADLELEIAQARLEVIRAKNDVVRTAQTSKASLAAAKARYDVESNKRKRAEQQIEACRVLAPCDGTVVYPTSGVGGSSRAGLQRGALVRGGQVLVRIVDMKQLQLVAQVRLNTAQKLSTGQKVKVIVDAFPNRSFRGRIVRIGVGDGRGGPAPASVTVHLEQSLKGLRPGMTANVELRPSPQVD